MSGDMAYITCYLIKDYELVLDSAPNIELKLQISE